jgi:hypothetical protein
MHDGGNDQSLKRYGRRLLGHQRYSKREALASSPFVAKISVQLEQLSIVILCTA